MSSVSREHSQERSPSPDLPHPSTAQPRNWLSPEYDDIFAHIVDDEQNRARRQLLIDEEKRKHREMTIAYQLQTESRAARQQVKLDKLNLEEDKRQEAIRAKFYQKNTTELPNLLTGAMPSQMSIAVPEAIMDKVGRKHVPIAHFIPEYMAAFRTKHQSSYSNSFAQTPVQNDDGTISMVIKSQAELAVPKVPEDEHLNIHQILSAQPAFLDALATRGIGREHIIGWGNLFEALWAHPDFYDLPDGPMIEAVYFAEHRRVYHQHANVGNFFPPGVIYEDLYQKVANRYRNRKINQAVKDEFSLLFL